MQTTATFFETLVDEYRPLLNAKLQHPTVRGIGAGDLPEDVFRFYIEQDYAYLLRYLRVIASGIVSSTDTETATMLAELVSSTFSLELAALAELYEQFGGDAGQLEQVRRAPTCQAYTDHLVATGARGSVFLLLAGVLPCQWGYREIGRTLKEAGLPDDPRFARWISEYSGDEYGDLVAWIIARFEALAEDASAVDRALARELFELGMRYEYDFWQMAWDKQQWPAIGAN